MEIEGAAITYEGWQQDSPQTEQTAATDLDFPPPAAGKRNKYDLEGQFSEFKKVVDNQLDKDDTETHYNLGIAYKEMGLFDDAINEFQTASIDPRRKIDCLTLQGICYRDKGDNSKAEEVFQNTLSMHDLTIEEMVSLSYELASLYESIGQAEDALRLYRQVRDENPAYRDVTKKIALLHGGDESPGKEMELLELDAEEE
jgi:tetratricopeptide (TPR) repeat protein